MTKYIFKRVLLSIFLLIAVSVPVFFLVHLIPGDPAGSFLGQGSSAQQVLKLQKELTPAGSLWDGYLEFLRNLVNLNLGKSFFNDRSVMDNIWTYLPNTLSL
ncbi:MAG: ABC transporter permease, partial [bacterium]|nr:ABC transporter permease [bacterium]